MPTSSDKPITPADLPKVPSGPAQGAMAKHTVSYTEVTCHPYALCTEDGCLWAIGRSRNTTAALCKAHVAETGHKVRRVKETVAVYYPSVSRSDDRN